MGPNATTQVDGTVYWMGRADFFQYNGTVSSIPCDVYNQVFLNINLDQRFKVACGYCQRFREVWWHYTSKNSTENDSYVTYNVYEHTWSFGTLSRTMYVGNSKVMTGVYATGADGYLYDHETGLNADTAPMDKQLSSWDIEVGVGDDIMHIAALIPDFKDIVGSVDMTLVGRKFPMDPEIITKGPYSIVNTTKQINPKMRCRQISINLDANALNTFWRFGGARIDATPDGKR